MKSIKPVFSWRQMAVLVSIGALPGLGCSLDGDEVSVGRTADAVNLDRCYPAAAGCNSHTPASIDSDFPEPPACADGKRLEPTYYPLPPLPEGFEDRIVGNGASAPDGSFWYLAIGYPKVPTSELPMHLFVYQVGPHGEELGKAPIAVSGSGDFATQMSLGVDADGTATVALSDGAITFHRFASGAKPAGVSGSLLPLPNQLFAMDSTTHYVVAGDSPSFDAHGILSRVRSDGTLERSSNQIPDLNGGSGLLGLTSTQAGYSLLAKQPDVPGGYRILSYDRELEPQWAVALPRSLQWGETAFVSDEQGRLLVAEELGDDQPSAVGLYGADADGSSLFAFLVPSSGDKPTNLLLTAQRGASRAWVHFDGLSLKSKQSDMPPHYLAELDLQAASCTLHEYAALEADSKSDLLVAPDGTLFMLTDAALVRFDEVAAE